MSENKVSYTVSCSSDFRDAVLALAARRRVNAADLARSIMLVLPEHLITLYPDPGEPHDDDRETVQLKSGPKNGKPLRRKPRLQVRLPSGLAPQTIRKSLNLALALAAGTMSMQVLDPTGPILGGGPSAPAKDPVAAMQMSDLTEQVRQEKEERTRLFEELERMRAILDVVSFDPLPDGVETRGEALFVFGYPPTANPDSRELRARFRLLATVHHPDSPYGSHRRMSQLNEAMDILRRR